MMLLIVWMKQSLDNQARGKAQKPGVFIRYLMSKQRSPIRILDNKFNLCTKIYVRISSRIRVEN